MHEFRQLTNEQRKRFIANIIRIKGERELAWAMKHCGLSSAFSWSDSAEGHNYWMEIDRRILR